MHGHFYILVEITEESCYLFISSNYKIVPPMLQNPLWKKNEWMKEKTNDYNRNSQSLAEAPGPWVDYLLERKKKEWKK